MFRLTVLIAVLAVALGFAPVQTRMQSNMRLQMSIDKSIAKAASGLLLSAAIFAAPAFAVEGASPKYSFFGTATSSPFAMTEEREDPLYSPYSPYGNGENAVYTKLAGKFNEMTSLFDTYLCIHHIFSNMKLYRLILYFILMCRW